MLEDHDIKKIGAIVREEVTAAEVRIVKKTTDAVVPLVVKQTTDAIIPVVVKQTTDAVVPLVVKQVVPLVVKQTTDAVVEMVGEMVEQNILPAIERVEKKTDAFPLLLDKHMERQTAIIKGTFVARQRKQEEKTDRLIALLRGKNILSVEEWSELQELRVFPSLDQEAAL